MVCQLACSRSSCGKPRRSRIGRAGTAEKAYISRLYGAKIAEWSTSWRSKRSRARPRRCTSSTQNANSRNSSRRIRRGVRIMGWIVGRAPHSTLGRFGRSEALLPLPSGERTGVRGGSCGKCGSNVALMPCLASPAPHLNPLPVGERRRTQRATLKRKQSELIRYVRLEEAPADLRELRLHRPLHRIDRFDQRAVAGARLHLRLDR